VQIEKENALQYCVWRSNECAECVEHLLLALIVLLMFFDAFAHHKWSKIPFTRLSYVNTI